MPIEKSTYGLFLLSCNSNCFDIIDFDSLKNKLAVEKIDLINCWSFLGIHDVGILVKSKSHLDPANSILGDYIHQINKNIKIERPDWSFGNGSELWSYIYNILGDSLFRKPGIKKYQFFEYWCDPMIPIYIKDELTQPNDLNTVDAIHYLKFGVKSLKELHEVCEYYKKNEQVKAIFIGFGLYELVVISKSKNYAEIGDLIHVIRDNSEKTVIASTNLIASSNKIHENRWVNASVLLKIFPGRGDNRIDIQDNRIWDGIKNIAERLGLRGVCIRDIHEYDSPHTLLRHGFFEVSVELSFDDIDKYFKLIDIFDYSYYIVDTSSSLNFDLSGSVG